jgi:hypothetical protein
VNYAPPVRRWRWRAIDDRCGRNRELKQLMSLAFVQLTVAGKFVDVVDGTQARRLRKVDA